MKSPKKIKLIKAKKNKLLCPKGFKAITLFGTVFVRKLSIEYEFNLTDKIDSVLKSHEMIHVKQAVSTCNSWFLFYILYLWQWLCNLPLLFINVYAPYRFIAFELEAFCNEANYKYYNEIQNGAVLWKKFNKLSLTKKYNYAKDYYSKSRIMYFREYINRYILKNL